MRKTLILLPLLCAITLLDGCGSLASTEIILIPMTQKDSEGREVTILRLMEEVDARVGYWDQESKGWKVGSHRVTLPKGWLLMAPPATTEK